MKMLRNTVRMLWNTVNILGETAKDVLRGSFRFLFFGESTSKDKRIRDRIQK